MSILAQPSQPPPFPVRRFTVDQYHRMIQAGILGEDDPAELLEGWIVPKMPHTPPHDVAVDQSQEAIRTRLPPGWRVRVQSAVTTDDSEPEPDLVVVPGPANRYSTRHPVPHEIALLAEVASTSLAHDRDVKGPLYAQAGIAVYWVINLVQRQIEVYTDPSGRDEPAGYRRRQDYQEHEAVPLVLEGKEIGTIPVRELLP